MKTLPLPKRLKLPPGDLSRRNRALVALLPWNLTVITDLPSYYLNAIAAHQQGDPLPPKKLVEMMGPQKIFGVASIPMEMMQLQVMNDPGRRIDFSCFSEYHEFFMRPSVEGKRVPHHSVRKMWPVFLSGRNRERETIVDGWHRFHAYVRAGAKKIPLIWYADE